MFLEHRLNILIFKMYIYLAKNPRYKDYTKKGSAMEHHAVEYGLCMETEHTTWYLNLITILLILDNHWTIDVTACIEWKTMRTQKENRKWMHNKNVSEWRKSENKARELKLHWPFIKRTTGIVDICRFSIWIYWLNIRV